MPYVIVINWESRNYGSKQIDPEGAARHPRERFVYVALRSVTLYYVTLRITLIMLSHTFKTIGMPGIENYFVTTYTIVKMAACSFLYLSYSCKIISYYINCSVSFLSNTPNTNKSNSKSKPDSIIGCQLCFQMQKRATNLS